MKNALPLVPKDAPLDPTLFSVDWPMVLEVLMVVVILSFLIERALALLFESRWFLNFELRRNRQGQKGMYKPLIAVLVAALVCYVWQFDAVSIIFHREQMTIIGAILTGAVIAGGSKASIKLFHDVLNVKSSYYTQTRGSASRQQRKESDSQDKE